MLGSRGVFRDYLKEAHRIARAYLGAKLAGRSKPGVIGKRKTKRIAVPPYERAENILAREIYRLASKAFIYRKGRVLEAHVRARDLPFIHKPRSPTDIDWAIRLVDGGSHEESALGIKNRETLLDSTASSHLATELNFAFHHDVKADMVVAFIHLVGGHEIISAKLAAGGYDLADETWLRPFVDRNLEHAKAVAKRSKAGGVSTIDEDDGWKVSPKKVVESASAKSDGWD